MPLAPGTKLGPYEVLALLGAGRQTREKAEWLAEGQRSFVQSTDRRPTVCFSDYWTSSYLEFEFLRQPLTTVLRRPYVMKFVAREVPPDLRGRTGDFGVLLGSIPRDFHVKSRELEEGCGGAPTFFLNAR